MKEPEDVIPFLGSPSHWKDGYSAKAVAEAWFRGFPKLVEHTLMHRCSTDIFRNLELIEVFLERKISLNGIGQPSQADAMAILATGPDLSVMAVEAKVKESFGEYVRDWLACHSPRSTKPKLLDTLCKTLGLETARVGHLRYQLLHRTASAIYEAKRYRAKSAVMMVHSFDHNDTGLQDYQEFASAMGFVGAAATFTVGPKLCEGMHLYLGWTADQLGNEGFAIVDGRKSDVGLY